MISNFKFQISNSEKGVSLIIAFFVMVTIIAVVVSLSILLYGQIKILGNISNAVSAFYLADSGIEKVLYYDRQEKVGETRGMCNICTPDVCPDCVCELPLEGTDCDPTTCTDCKIKFNTPVEENKSSYSLDITVNQQCKSSSGSMNSYGIYESSSRAIMVSLNTKATVGVAPNIGDTYVLVTDGGGDGVDMDIWATVTDDGSITVTAGVTGRGDDTKTSADCVTACSDPYASKCCYREIQLTGGAPTYHKGWNGGRADQTYTVSVWADDGNNCVEVQNVEIR